MRTAICATYGIEMPVFEALDAVITWRAAQTPDRREEIQA